MLLFVNMFVDLLFINMVVGMCLFVNMFVHLLFLNKHAVGKQAS